MKCICYHAPEEHEARGCAVCKEKQNKGSKDPLCMWDGKMDWPLKGSARKRLSSKQIKKQTKNKPRQKRWRLAPVLTSCSPEAMRFAAACLYQRAEKVRRPLTKSLLKDTARLLNFLAAHSHETLAQGGEGANGRAFG